MSDFTQALKKPGDPGWEPQTKHLVKLLERNRGTARFGRYEFRLEGTWDKSELNRNITSNCE